MIIKKININFLLLILAIILLRSIEINSFSSPLLSSYIELEESIVEIEEENYFKGLLQNSFDGDRNAIISTYNFHITNPFDVNLNLLSFESKDFPKKFHLYILFIVV